MLKSEARKKYKIKRKELDDQLLTEISKGICLQFFNHFDFHNQLISTFLPISELKEIDTYRIIEEGIARGYHFAVPKIVDEFKLEHFEFNDRNTVEKNSLGIPEPIIGKNVAVSQIDVVLVPLLAFDSFGHRIGYGKGYYDRFLADCNSKTLFIGLSHFEVMNEPISDLHPLDCPLNYCITPTKVYEF